MSQAVISLGSNIEPRIATLLKAVESLNRGELEVVSLSNLFETSPVDVEDQADFLNMVALVDTELPPQVLLETLQAIEAAAGKNVERRRGPRTLDLDLVLLGNQIVNTEKLTLPHPRMHQRAFVLIPLKQVAPGIRNPATGMRIDDMIAALPAGQKIRDLGPIPLDRGIRE